MKRFAASVLDSLGLQVDRSAKVKVWRPTASDPRTSGLVLEIFGPGAVGKTMLRRRLQPSVQERWLSMAELYEHDFVALSETVDDQVRDVYQELFRLRVDNVLRGDVYRGVINQVEVVALSARILLSNLALEGRPLPFGVFKDDGLLSSCADEVLALLGSGHPGLDEALARRRAVCLSSTPEWLVDRMKGCRDAGGDVAHFPGYSDEDLVRYADRQLEFLERYVAALRLHGVEILELHQSDGFERNRDRFLRFEASIVSPREHRAA